MFFTQWHFLVIYLPIFVFLFYIVPAKYREYVLLLGGLIFGFSAQWLMLTLVVNLLLAFTIKKTRHYAKRVWFIIGVLVNVSFVLVCKFYYNRVPVGVGFALFQYISYLYYLYRYQSEDVDVLKYFNYFLFFPKTVQGPIVSYKKFYSSFKYRTDFEMLETGIEHLSLGLFFKIWIADRFAILWNDVLMVGIDSISTPLAWAGMAAFCAMLYFDFQGYSLMAIGIAEMLGISLPQNFNHPYISKTVSEFYRRWHITLGQWFKEFVYIPLGGNRVGKKRLFLNLLIVWLLTGIWHGNGLNYLLWALCLFVLIILEKTIWGDFLSRHNVISRIYIWLVMPLTWIVFALTDIKEIGIYFTKLFPFGNVSEFLHYSDLITYGKNQIITVIVAFFVSLPVWDKVAIKHKGDWWFKIVTAIILSVSLYGVVISESSPFMYSTF